VGVGPTSAVTGPPPPSTVNAFGASAARRRRTVSELLASTGTVLEAPEALDPLGVPPRVLVGDLDTGQSDPKVPTVARARPEGGRDDGQVEEPRREEDAGTGGAEPGIGIQRLDEGTQPMRVDEGVVVDQGHVVQALEVRHGHVVGGKAEIGPRGADLEVREPAPELAVAAVGRGVVDHHDLEVGGRPVGAAERLHAVDDVTAAVVVQDDGTDAGGHGAVRIGRSP
jgi:hypothetical protein